MKAVLVLEDGTVIEGKGFGAEGKALGEIVFATGMTGYVESLTDPSYAGQILMFTYPLIGNYGVSEEDYESDGIKAEGVVVREACFRPSNWRSQKDINEFLLEFGIPGIYGVDTRALTKKIRVHGTMKAVLRTYNGEVDIEALKREAREQKSISELKLVKRVAADEVERIELGDGRYEVALVDCGVKRSIINNLLSRGMNVTIFPFDAPAVKPSFRCGPDLERPGGPGGCGGDDRRGEEAHR